MDDRALYRPVHYFGSQKKLCIQNIENPIIPAIYTQALLVYTLMTIAEARFGQKQVTTPATAALSSFDSSGQAAGQFVSFLLATANLCGKLSQADLIVPTLGTDSQVIDAARALVAAEQNFNPFVVSVPSICSDTSFPVTAELRGVVPLVDASVVGSDVENANEVSSLNTPFNADGLSAAKVIAAAGLSNFTTKAADGTVGSSGASSNSSALVAVISASIASSSVSPGRGSNFKCSGSELWWSRYHIRVDQICLFDVHRGHWQL